MGKGRNGKYFLISPTSPPGDFLPSSLRSTSAIKMTATLQDLPLELWEMMVLEEVAATASVKSSFGAPPSPPLGRHCSSPTSTTQSISLVLKPSRHSCLFRVGLAIVPPHSPYMGSTPTTVETFSLLLSAGRFCGSSQVSKEGA